MRPIHGHGGKFHLHGGKLETMEGDADFNRPAAGICSGKYQRWGDEDWKESRCKFTRPVEHIHGHGGNFHLYNGHLEHVIGDADVNPPAAGMSTKELSELY